MSTEAYKRASKRAPCRTSDRPPRQKIKHALGYLNPNVPRANWWPIVAAIHAWDSGEEGFALADAWSRAAGEPRYPGERAMRREWQRIHSGSLTIATLFKHAVESGWKPRREYSGTNAVVEARRAVTIEAPAPDLRPIVDRAIEATPAAWPAALARTLSLPMPAGGEALRRLGVHRDRESVSGWPMVDAEGRVVGVRYRAHDGAKWCRTGSRNALFAVWPLPAGAPLLLPEGGTDAAALVALGYPAVAGRPSCNGGVDHVRALVRRARPTSCIVVADADAPGQRGAHELAQLLALHVADVRIITPPSPAKDVRAWVAAGATRDDVDLLIAAAPRVALCIGGRE